MNDNIPTDDSIILPEGLVEDDVKLLIMHKAFSELLSGETQEEKERRFE